MTLFLTIKKKYLDEILSGDKKVEYRKKNDFYKNKIEKQKVDSLHLRAGYSKSSPELLIEVKEIDKNCYHSEIGESYGFILGDIIEYNI